MMEAASFGIPIVSTDVGGVREIVESGYNGQLLGERASADEFADFIKRYYDMDKSERDFYRENSRKLWERSFNAGKAYPDYDISEKWCFENKLRRSEQGKTLV